MTDSSGHELNSNLFSSSYLQSMGINEHIHPLVINAYAAHKYRLSVGSTITININNMVDRIVQQIHNDQVYNNEAKFKVVGVSVGTTNESFYTTQQIANKIIGLPDGSS